MSPQNSLLKKIAHKRSVPEEKASKIKLKDAIISLYKR